MDINFRVLTPSLPNSFSGEFRLGFFLGGGGGGGGRVGVGTDVLFLLKLTPLHKVSC